MRRARSPTSWSAATSRDASWTSRGCAASTASLPRAVRWCGPCRAIAPLVDQLAVEHKGKLKVAKLDVDTNIRTPARFQVRSIPAILFFKDGKLVDQVIGAVPKSQLETKFKQHAA